MTTEEELDQLRQENRALREVKQELREGLGQAIGAIEALQERVKELEELRRENSALRAEGTRLQEQLRALQEIASADNAKVVVPYEATSLMGAAEVLLSTLRNDDLGGGSGGSGGNGATPEVVATPARPPKDPPPQR